MRDKHFPHYAISMAPHFLALGWGLSGLAHSLVGWLEFYTTVTYKVVHVKFMWGY